MVDKLGISFTGAQMTETIRRFPGLAGVRQGRRRRQGATNCTLELDTGVRLADPDASPYVRG
jgi:hypothetical protein